MSTNSPVSTTPEDTQTVSVPPGGLSQSGEVLTGDHLDGGVHLPPVRSAVKLPVQDEVAVVGDHGPLREQKLHTSVSERTSSVREIQLNLREEKKKNQCSSR